MAPLALVANLATRWRHLHCFQSWPTDCITCIATLLYRHYQLSWYPHQPESHQLSLNNVSYSLTHSHPDTTIGPQVYLGPIKIRIRIKLERIKPWWWHFFLCRRRDRSQWPSKRVSPTPPPFARGWGGGGLWWCNEVCDVEFKTYFCSTPGLERDDFYKVLRTRNQEHRLPKQTA